MGDSLIEAAKDFKNTLQERIKSPILGTFILAWIWINWKGISVFLFSNISVENRIKIIALNYSDYWNTLWLPLLISLAYAIALPFIHWGTEYLSSEAYKGRENVKANKREAFFKRQVDVKRAEVELDIEETKHRELLINKNHVKDLESQLETLQKAYTDSQATQASTTETLRNQLDIYRLKIEQLMKDADENNTMLQNQISMKEQVIRELKSPPRVLRSLVQFKGGQKAIEIVFGFGDGVTTVSRYYNIDGTRLNNKLVAEYLSEETVRLKSLPIEKL